MNKPAQSEDEDPGHDQCDFLPNPMRLPDDLLDEVERAGNIRLEVSHRRRLRATLPLDVYYQPLISLLELPKAQREREARRRLPRFKRIAKFANQLANELDKEIDDNADQDITLERNLQRLGERDDLHVFANKLRTMRSATRLKAEKSEGRYAPYRDMVLQFAQIYKSAGGTPSTYWDDGKGSRCGPFWRAFKVLCRRMPLEFPKPTERRRPRAEDREPLDVWVEGLAEHANNNNWFGKARPRRGKK